MWQLIPYYYSDTYVVYWLAEFFHSWPHISYDGFKQHSAIFDPYRQTYIETLIFWAGLPVLWLIATLGILFVYCCCQCCKRRRRFRQGIHRQLKNAKAYQWLLIAVALLCTGAIGVGFYGNEGIASGLAHFINVAEQANGTIEDTELQVSTLNKDLGKNLTQEITGMRNSIEQSSINETVKQNLIQLTINLNKHVQPAVSNVSYINNIVEDNALDVTWFAQEVTKYEYFRWVGVIVVLCLQLIICLFALCGAGKRSKPILAGVSVLSTILLIIIWAMVGGEIFVTISASDLCVDPNSFLIREAQRNSRFSEDVLRYYIQCNSTSISPFKKSLQQANKDLSLADSYQDGIVKTAKPYYLEEPNLRHKIELVSSSLDLVQSDLTTVTGALDCNTINQDYTTALYSVCYDALTGVSLLLVSSVAAGLLLFFSVFLSANLIKNIVKRKNDYAVDQEDPFLPPNNNPTLERFRRTPDGPYRRTIEASPGPRLSYQGSIQYGRRSENDARPQGPLGSPGYTAGARSSFVDDSPLMTSGGFESPPPSYTLAMSRDNQNNSRNHPSSRNSRHNATSQDSGASLV